jgi:hypothetical protein
MKTFLFGLTLLTLTACGVSERLGQNCGGDLQQACRTVFGGDANESLEANDEHLQSQLDVLLLRVRALEQQNSSTLMTLNAQAALTSALAASVQSLEAALPLLADLNQIAALQTQINTLNINIQNLETQIGTPVTGLQAVVTQNTQVILQLQQNHNVTKIVDPCGNGPGYDEVFFRTSTGMLIASFSDNASGLNTRFAELVPGNYTTTDGTGCNFTVNVDKTVSPSVEY